MKLSAILFPVFCLGCTSSGESISDQYKDQVTIEIISVSDTTATMRSTNHKDFPVIVGSCLIGYNDTTFPVWPKFEDSTPLGSGESWDYTIEFDQVMEKFAWFCGFQSAREQDLDLIEPPIYNVQGSYPSETTVFVDH